jgi:hypothetical protein
MPVPASINDLSTTVGSNSPSGSESPGDGDNYIRSLSAFIATLRDKLNGTSDTGTLKNATFSGTMAGAAAWAALQTFAAGIKLGTGSTLANYVTGTFTPVVEGTGTAGTGTYTTQSGTYTRIGNRVFVSFKVAWSAHTGVGNLFITGLPVTGASATARLDGSCAVGAYEVPAFVNLATSGAKTGNLNIFDASALNPAYTTPTFWGAGSISMSGHYDV